MEQSTDPYHVPTDPQALREGAKRGAERQKALVPDLILYWRHVVAIERRGLWRSYGFTSFDAYCKEELELENRSYILSCMGIARLDPLRFRGCMLPVGALILAANGLGEEAQRALADATRGGSSRGCSGIIGAIEKVIKLDDAAAAMYLRAWVRDGKEMVFSTDEPTGEPPPPPSATSLCRRISAAAQLQQSLTLQLCDAVAAGDRPAPTAACEMRAQIKDCAPATAPARILLRANITATRTPRLFSPSRLRTSATTDLDSPVFRPSLAKVTDSRLSSVSCSAVPRRGCTARISGSRSRSFCS